MTPAATFDFQKPYMEAWLRFIGIEEITTMTVEKTLFGPDVDADARAAAKTEAVAAVSRYVDGATALATA
jgi:FMN-dependent NADH-azoreductase